MVSRLLISILQQLLIGFGTRFPEYLAPTLTGISIFCLAKRDSPWVTRIFGGSNGNEGLGMLSISLDWNYIGSYLTEV